jgi:hypothetical protein
MRQSRQHGQACSHRSRHSRQSARSDHAKVPCTAPALRACAEQCRVGGKPRPPPDAVRASPRRAGECSPSRPAFPWCRSPAGAAGSAPRRRRRRARWHLPFVSLDPVDRVPRFFVVGLVQACPRDESLSHTGCADPGRRPRRPRPLPAQAPAGTGPAQNPSPRGSALMSAGPAGPRATGCSARDSGLVTEGKHDRHQQHPARRG